MVPMGVASFRPALTAYYQTNPIARASAVMGDLAAMEKARATLALAAE